MGAFKDKKSGSWYVQFRYTDWQGKRQQKLKRGFATKHEALEWEREFLLQKQTDVTMSFGSFYELYKKDIKPRLKENTWQTKENIIEGKIIPYFKDRKLCDISATDVIEWQNEIRTPFTISSALCSITLCVITACVPILRPSQEIWVKRKARR